MVLIINESFRLWCLFFKFNRHEFPESGNTPRLTPWQTGLLLSVVVLEKQELSGLDITPNFEYCPSTSSMQTYSNYDIPDTNHDMHSTVTQGTFLHDLYEIQDQNSHTKSARYISTQCPPASAGLN